MTGLVRIAAVALFVLTLLIHPGAASAQTSFIYSSALPTAVTGSYDFQFKLFNAPTAGKQIGSTLTITSVAVSAGSYTVTLDFGAATFSASPLYLEISYRVHNVGSYKKITARAPLVTGFSGVSLLSLNTLALQGIPVSPTAPTLGQLLTFDGVQWMPSDPPADTAYSAGAGLLLTGTVFSIVDGGVIETMFADGSVTTAKIAAGAVNTDQIADGAVSAAKITWPLVLSSTSDGPLMSLTNSGTGPGVYGATNTYAHAGVSGYNSQGNGVYGESALFNGVSGYSASQVGVAGGSTDGIGVYGATTRLFGVRGDSTNGNGVYGYSFNGDGVTGFSVNGNAANFRGIMTATDKRFRIDHPLDPANKYLNHACVESSERMNIYTGNVTTNGTGDAEVLLPDWFEALNQDFRYQLTVIGQFAQAIVATKIAHNRFTIKTDKPSVEVSWQVTGVRQDAYANAHPMQVEEEKKAKDRGRYLHPTEHGMPERLGIDFEMLQRPVAPRK